MEPYSQVNQAAMKGPLSCQIMFACDLFALSRSCIRIKTRIKGSLCHRICGVPAPSCRPHTRARALGKGPPPPRSGPRASVWGLASPPDSPGQAFPDFCPGRAWPPEWDGQTRVGRTSLWAAMCACLSGFPDAWAPGLGDARGRGGKPGRRRPAPRCQAGLGRT